MIFIPHCRVEEKVATKQIPGFTCYFGMCSVLQSYSPVQLFVIPWTVARQAPLSMEFSRQE